MLSIPTVQLPEGIIDNCNEWLGNAIYRESIETQLTANTNRQTLSFGYDYFKLNQNDRSFKDIPVSLQELCKHSVTAFRQEFALPSYKDFTNVIVSIYQEGYELEPHVDVSRLNMSTGGNPVDYYFGEHVIGVILQEDIQGKFYIVESKDDSKPYNQPKILELNETKGLGFLLTGKLRYKPYYHGVSKVKSRRVSVTFRTVEFS
jgi:hypothetical protein